MVVVVVVAVVVVAMEVGTRVKEAGVMVGGVAV